MADFKSRHAFGAEANVDNAIAQGLIDAYDVLFLNEGKIGWVDKNGKKIILPNREQVIKVDVLPDVGKDDVVYICKTKMYVWDGEKYVTPADFCEGVSEERLGNVVDELKAYTEAEVASAKTYTDSAVVDAKAYADDKAAVSEKVRYEVVSKPEGTVVSYGEREVRILCSPNTKWTQQSVGANGDASQYYLGFRAYAPEGAVTFKEGFEAVEDKVFTFDDDFAGVDEYGRKYSVIWLAAAKYDSDTDTWSYYGDKSTPEHYLGWTYVVEWYGEGGVLLDSDMIRINLSNNACHYSVEPYFVGKVVADANAYTDEQIKKNSVTVVEF